MREILEQVRIDLGKGRLIQATEGLSAAILALDARVATIEAKDREANCICKVKDSADEYEIIKRIQASEERMVFTVDVGTMNEEDIKSKLETIKEELAAEKPKRAKK